MKLIKTLVVEGSLEELLKQAAPGEHIVVCESDTGDYWGTHPRGVVFPEKDQLLLNGEEVLYVGEFNDWGTHGEEFVILQGKDLIFGQDQTFLRNGRDVLYKGSYDTWKMHPEGVVIQQGKKLLLNGSHLLYEGDFEEWALHPKGVVVRIGDRFLLNGEELLYEGEWSEWESTAEIGFVIENDNQLFFEDGRHIRLPSTEGYVGWHIHSLGAIFQTKNQFLLYPFSTTT